MSVLGNSALQAATDENKEAETFAGDDAFLCEDGQSMTVNPCDVRRAGTAPMVLTRYFGGKCYPSCFEEEISPEEQYRLTRQYHDDYYSRCPRDPRMPVPVRFPMETEFDREAARQNYSVVRQHEKEAVGIDGDSIVPGTSASAKGGSSSGVCAGKTDPGEEPTESTVEDPPVPLNLAGESVTAEKYAENAKEFRSCLTNRGAGATSPTSVDSISTSVGREFLNAESDDDFVKGTAMPQPSSHDMEQRRQSEPHQRQVPHIRSQTTTGAGQKNTHQSQSDSGEACDVKLVNENHCLSREYLESGHSPGASGGHIIDVVSICKDQDGSRWFQRLLNYPQNVEKVFNEVFPHTHELITDVFGNYVLQKLLDTLSPESEMCKQLIKQVSGRLKEYSFQMYGCRVIQKMLEKASPEKREEVLLELKDCLVDCIFDQNANHVAQKLIEVIPEKTQLLVDSFLPHLKSLSRHPYGCRVLQCVFERCSTARGVDIRPMLQAVLDNIHEYVRDQYGNYVVQYALLNAPDDLRQRFVSQLIPHVYAFSCSKFASNVAEKTILKANEEELQQIVEGLTHPLGGFEDGNYLVLMMQDQYANYVVQRLLHQVTKAQLQQIAERVRPHLYRIRRSVYGQHLVQKMESMGMPLWGEVGTVYDASFPCEFNGMHAQSGGARGGRKMRGGPVSHSCAGGQQGLHGGSLGLLEHSLIPATPFPQQAPDAVTIGGQPMLPLTTATGPTCGYGYISPPTDTMLVAQTQSQPQPQLPMTAPGLTLSSQACFPGMMPQPHQSPHDGREFYPANLVYTRGQEDLMSHTAGTNFGHQLHAYPTTMATRVVYGGAPQTFYSCMPTL